MFKYINYLIAVLTLNPIFVNKTKHIDKYSVSVLYNFCINMSKIIPIITKEFIKKSYLKQYNPIILL